MLVLRVICNQLLRESFFTDSWRQSLITPPLKSGNRHVVENLRDVSILNAISKIFDPIYCKETDNLDLNIVSP